MVKMEKETFILVMPAYNEEECIEKVVSSWMTIIKNYPGSEMLVINDGSKDKTGEKLDLLEKRYRELKVIHKPNEGHGATVIRGYKEAINTNHNWVFQTDSDDQFIPEDFIELWKKRNKSSFILGSRLKRSDPLHRLIITKIIRFFNLAIFGTYIKDANIPYRLIKKNYLKKLLKILPKNLFAPNIFLSIIAARDNQNLMSVPISHKERKTGQISIVKWNLIKACFRGLKELVKFRIKLSSMLKKLNQNEHEYSLIIGAGITGITIARNLAERGEKCLIVEKRAHIGGNCYDFFNTDGQYIQKYGPHIFHTTDEEVWNYLSEFTKWNNYQHKVLAYVEGNLIPIPFNLKSVKIAFKEEMANRIKDKMMKRVGNENSISILELKKIDDPDIRKLANYIYNNIFLNYTIKQWDLKPEEIDPQVTSRVPIVVSEDDRYFPKDPYQGIPSKGFSAMFKKMLAHKNIKVLLETDYKEKINLFNFKRIIVTSPIDDFFSYKFGKIEYRRINIRFEEYDCESFQENSVINYPNDFEYTRITEYNKFLSLKRKKTVISKEIPSWEEGFIAYPLLTNENKVLIDKYLIEAKKKKNVFFAGRLADCKYYNMDQACRRALDLINKEIFTD